MKEAKKSTNGINHHSQRLFTLFWGQTVLTYVWNLKKNGSEEPFEKFLLRIFKVLWKMSAVFLILKVMAMLNEEINGNLLEVFETELINL